MQDEHWEVSVDQDTVVLTLGSGDESSTLYLAIDEARSLVSEIRSGLLADNGDAIVVCDVQLSVNDAWNVLLTVEEVLSRGRCMEVGSPTSHAPHRANWIVEGF